MDRCVCTYIANSSGADLDDIYKVVVKIRLSSTNCVRPELVQAYTISMSIIITIIIIIVNVLRTEQHD
jgi:hypothetical protein